MTRRAAAPPPTPVLAGVRSVAGVDLSLTSTGICRLAWPDDDPASTPAARTFRIRSEPDGTTLADQANRHADIRARVVDAVLRADLVVMEGPMLGFTRPGMFPLWGLWWQVLGDLHGAGCQLAQVAPSSLKVYVTGYGGSPKQPVTKAEMHRAVEQRYPQLLTGGSHDVAEAIGLAAMCARHIGRPIDQLPAVHLAAMSKIRWPQLPGGNDPCP